MQVTGITIDQAILKPVKPIDVVERTHRKLKQLLKINVTADTPHWDRYVNLAVMAHNTTYHQTIKRTQTEIFLDAFHKTR